jgi:activator of HSP90 ATPase
MAYDEQRAANIIHQNVRFNVSPAELFTIYLDSKKHGAAIGGKVSISRKIGAPFTAFGGGLKGRNLMIVPNRMIVQSWRADSWKKNDADSILILLFSRADRGGRIELVQANVPAHTHALIKNGWPKHYWTSWKKYLANRRSQY